MSNAKITWGLLIRHKRAIHQTQINGDRTLHITIADDGTTTLYRKIDGNAVALSSFNTVDEAKKFADSNCCNDGKYLARA